MQHHPIPHKIDRIIPWEGRDYRYFSGTAYLGMGSVPAFEKHIIQGIQQYGPNHGASRFSNVQLEVYDALEQQFAREAGAPFGALLSSGFMAGYLSQTLLYALADEVWAAPDAHPAILPAHFQPDPSQSFGEYAQECIERSHHTKGKTIAILSNAVDTILPSVHDFHWVKQLSAENTYYLLIDDSHAFGLLGKGIYGTYGQWKSLPARLIVVGSLGKALAIPAGMILGDAFFIEKVKNSAIFRGASPAAPGYCEAFLNAESLYSRQQSLLQENMEYFFGHLDEDTKAALRYDPRFPVVTFRNSGWAQKLLDKGVMISSFSYPRPEDAPVDRIILSAYHTKEDLDLLAAAVREQ
ncbi:aminotransferase class I/II-fold pyridoxal phosphate-dependent enzyme [Echinicola vietnamensis]|uniref:7-keto-8-aminopelargonate synthetase-like enzyme n=1 Tax=Echinicola vietnamensis (strain DSM 17526 / LMG 23754 / KMM 6221) TaxID=926556 RepID=L0FTB2_ECHVK|nr:aminotransferase class I/II-fold pyridoxal phosphate-dependent enzyme [Echinicola vietnamensis]AGA77144.1 7-keto-8-aminopelargonate synthetase-like enzyme [Echinicola vietnamensis DSM 17526]